MEVGKGVGEGFWGDDLRGRQSWESDGAPWNFYGLV